MTESDEGTPCDGGGGEVMKNDMQLTEKTEISNPSYGLKNTGSIFRWQMKRESKGGVAREISSAANIS